MAYVMTPEEVERREEEWRQYGIRAVGTNLSAAAMAAGNLGQMALRAEIQAIEERYMVANWQAYRGYLKPANDGWPGVAVCGGGAASVVYTTVDAVCVCDGRTC